MLCLLFAETNSTKGLGPVAAIGIVVGLAVMLTLLPVLLTLCGRWIFWPQRPRFGTPEPTTTGLWSRVGTRIGRRPRAVWVVTALVLVACAVGISQLSATGLTNSRVVPRPPRLGGRRDRAQHAPRGRGRGTGRRHQQGGPG